MISFSEVESVLKEIGFEVRLETEGRVLFAHAESGALISMPSERIRAIFIETAGRVLEDHKLITKNAFEVELGYKAISEDDLNDLIAAQLNCHARSCRKAGE